MSETGMNYEISKAEVDKLKKAMEEGFLLDALFLEYALIEERCETLLKMSGIFQLDKHNTLQNRLKRIDDVTSGKVSLMGRYITHAMTNDIRAWIMERDRLLQLVLKQNQTGDQLEKLTAQGLQLIKLLNAKATTYKRVLEREGKLPIIGKIG